MVDLNRIYYKALLALFALVFTPLARADLQERSETRALAQAKTWVSRHIHVDARRLESENHVTNVIIHINNLEEDLQGLDQDQKILVAWSVFEKIEQLRTELVRESEAGQDFALWMFQRGEGIFLLDTLSNDGWPPKWISEAWKTTRRVVRETVEIAWDYTEMGLASYLTYKYGLPKDFTYGFLDGVADTLTLKTLDEDASALIGGVAAGFAGRLIRQLIKNNVIYKLLMVAATLASLEPFIESRIEKNRNKYSGKSKDYIRGRATLDIVKDMALMFAGIKAETELYGVLLRTAKKNPLLMAIWQEIAAFAKPTPSTAPKASPPETRAPSSHVPNQSRQIAQEAIDDIRIGGGRQPTEPIRIQPASPNAPPTRPTAPLPSSGPPLSGGSKGTATLTEPKIASLASRASSPAPSREGSLPMTATFATTQTENNGLENTFENMPEQDEIPSFFIIRKTNQEGDLGIDATTWTLDRETLQGQHGRLVMKNGGNLPPRKVWIIPESAGALDEYWAYEHSLILNRDRTSEDQVRVPITELWLVRARDTNEPYLIALQEEPGVKITDEMRSTAEKMLPRSLLELDQSLGRPTPRRWANFRFKGLRQTYPTLKYDEVYALQNLGIQDETAFTRHQSIPYRIYGSVSKLTDESVQALVERALFSSIAKNLLNDVPEEELERWYREWLEQTRSTKGRKDYVQILQEALSGGVLTPEHLNALRMLQQRCRSSIKSARPSDELCAKVDRLLSGSRSSNQGKSISLDNEIRADDPWGDNHQKQWDAWLQTSGLTGSHDRCREILQSGAPAATKCKNLFKKILKACNEKENYPGVALCSKVIANLTGTSTSQGSESSAAWALSTYEKLKSVNALKSTFGEATPKQALSLLSDIHHLSGSTLVRQDLETLTTRSITERKFSRLRAYFSLYYLHIKSGPHTQDLVQSTLYGAKSKEQFFKMLGLPDLKLIKSYSPRIWLELYVASDFFNAMVDSQFWKTNFPSLAGRMGSRGGNHVKTTILNSFILPKYYADNEVLGWIDEIFAHYYAGDPASMTRDIQTYLLLTHPSHPRFIASVFNLETGEDLVRLLEAKGLTHALFGSLVDRNLSIQFANDFLSTFRTNIPNLVSLGLQAEASYMALVASVFRSLLYDFNMSQARLTWARIVVGTYPSRAPEYEAWIFGLTHGDRLLEIERQGKWKLYFGLLSRLEVEELLRNLEKKISFEYVLEYFRFVQLNLLRQSKTVLTLSMEKAENKGWWKSDNRWLRLAGIDRSADSIMDFLKNDTAFFDACKLYGGTLPICLKNVEKVLALKEDPFEWVEWAEYLHGAMKETSYHLRTTRFLKLLRGDQFNNLSNQYAISMQYVVFINEEMDHLFMNIDRKGLYVSVFGSTPRTKVEEIFMKIFMHLDAHETRRHFREMHRLINDDEKSDRVVPYLMFVFPDSKSLLQDLRSPNLPQ